LWKSGEGVIFVFRYVQFLNFDQMLHFACANKSGENTLFEEGHLYKAAFQVSEAENHQEDAGGMISAIARDFGSTTQQARSADKRNGRRSVIRTAISTAGEY